jgi:putative membrane-bound dehydrogenase-like protein
MGPLSTIDESPSSRRKRGWQSLLFAVALRLLGLAMRSPVFAEAPSARLERFDPLEPSQAIDTFDLAPGYQIELAAAEPLVRDPIAMEFDEEGAAYVIELPPYNQYAKPGAAARGSIRRMTDADGDGKFDSSAVFSDDLTFPTGLFCYDGGLFVGDAPDLLFLKDEDGDGKAERREKILTGFGTELSGEGQLNSFRWGLDNRIHLSTGRDGGAVYAVNDPQGPRVDVRSRRVVFDPRTRTFETSGGGGQHGMAFDDWGRLFACDNSEPIIQIAFDDRYLRRNPWMSSPTATRSLAPDGKFTKLTRISPVEPWRIIRTQLRTSGQFAGPAEGGTPSGFFTAATGVTVYRGDAWPAIDHGSILVGEAANNLVYRARLAGFGKQLVAMRADRGREFLASRDTWFRPVQFAQGPDGTLYMLDMYRELIEGAAFLPEEVLAQMDPLAGSDRGRIYRIVPEGKLIPSQPPLAGAAVDELVELLAHPNGWTRDTAARLLYERQDLAAVEPLRRMTQSDASALGRLHALYALQGLGELNAEDLLARLGDQSPRVRQHAVRLSEAFASDDKSLQERIMKLADDDDGEVRLQLAFSLGVLSPELRRAPLMKLLARDGESELLRTALQSSLVDDAVAFLAAILSDDELPTSPGTMQLIESLASQVAHSGKADQFADLAEAVEGLAHDRTNTDALISAIAVGFLSFEGHSNGVALPKGRLARVVAQLSVEAQSTALNEQSSLDARLRALTLLEGAPIDTLLELARQLLEPRQPQPLQAAALVALSRRNDPRVADAIIGQWNSFSPATRVAALPLLASRAQWSEHLLRAFEQNLIAANEIDASMLALLRRHSNPDVRRLAEEIASRGGTAERDAVVAEYQRALELAGDPSRGAKAFAKACATCHELNGVGVAIGADLRAIGDRGASSVLLNILDPNREIKPQFFTYVIQTVDGRGVAGMIDRETSNDIYLRQSDGSVQRIARADVEQMTSTGLSYMPEGLEKQLDLQSMADLLAYLDSIL